MATFTAGFSGNGQYRLRAEVTQGTQSIDNNTTVVNYSLYVDKLSGSGYWTNSSGNSSSLGGDMSGASGIGGWWAPYDFRDYGSLLIATGSKTVTHNADGTKTLSATFGANDSEGGNFGSASGSISMPLTTIPRATTPTLTPNPVEVGQSVTIGLPRASASFTHDVSYTIGSASGTIATGAGTSTSWTPPISLLTQMVTLMSAPVTITVVTKNGGTPIGTKTATLTVQAPDGSPYVTPTILASVERSLSDGTPDPDGVCLLLHLDAAVASIDTGTEQNDLSYKVEAKPRGTGTWHVLDEDSAGALTIDDGLVYVEWDTAEEFDTGSSYDVRVTVTDEIGSAAVSVLILTTSEALLDVYKPTRGLAVGQVFDTGVGGSLQLFDRGYQRQGVALLDAGDFASDAQTIAGVADDLAVTPEGLRAALVPLPGVIPGSVTVSSGSASVAADGLVTATNVGALFLNNFLPSDGVFEIYLNSTKNATSAVVFSRLRNNTTTISSGVYYYTNITWLLGSGPNRYSGTFVGEFGYWAPASIAAGEVGGRMTLFRRGGLTQILTSSYVFGGGDRRRTQEYGNSGATSNGLAILVSGGSFSGTVKIVRVA